MMQHKRQLLCFVTLPLAILGCLTPINSTRAQIVPDNTLGAESSVITPDTIKGISSDRIDGGAIRGSNLFHSFGEFNIDAGRAAYFTNPALIENILSRVTGGSASQILGTLGVLGKANLFLINPNGIIFGPNARLDVAGSFFASTADKLVFDRGVEFSATDPQAPPLLTVNIPIGLQYRQQQMGTVVNAGNLAAGGDLSLLAGNLDLQGQLSASGNLTLFAADTLRVRDSVANPFVAAAGGQLLIQGNRAVDIFALNHANSGLFSGGDMVLRSANTVAGDAHYWSGGNFRIENLDGQMGNLSSPHDPIILSGSDVSLGDYKGASLHILAGGSVTLANVEIDGTDSGENTINPGNPNPFLASLSNLQLSDGTSVTIDGSNQATLDVRAGIDWTTFPTLGVGNTTIGTMSPPPNFAIAATSANITVNGNIAVSQADGKVLLTNQYRPNSLLGGNISTQGINTGRWSDGANFLPGNGGTITIDGRDSVTTGVLSSNSLSGNAGDIKLAAFGDIIAGDISSIIGNNTSNGKISSSIDSSYPPAHSGDISLISKNGGVRLDKSKISSIVGMGAVGSGGNVSITAKSVALTNGAWLDTRLLGRGQAGSVTVDASDTVSFDGFSVGIERESERQFNTGVVSMVGDYDVTTAQGKGGNIDITAKSVALTNGARLNTNTWGKGNAGDVTIKASDTVSLDGADSREKLPSSALSNVEPPAKGDAGNVLIETGSLSVTNGGLLESRTYGKGNAGNVKIRARDTVSFDGVFEGVYERVSYDPAKRRWNSGAVSGVGREDDYKNAQGNGGNIYIQAKSVSLTNGARLDTNTFAKGNAGNVTINASDTVSFDGVFKGKQLDNSGAFSSVESTAEGKGGDINIQAKSVALTNGAQVTVSSEGNGAAGNIKVTKTEDILLNNNASLSAKTTGGQGNIELRSRDIVLRRNSDITAEAEGAAAGGNVTIDTENLVAFPGEDSDIVATAQGGNGGRIRINALGVFGLEERKATLGNRTNDIDASSELGAPGEVLLNRVLDPNRGLVELPENVVDPNEQIAQNPCQRGKKSKFVMTGRGGLPLSPNEAASSEAVRVGLVEPAPMGGRGDSGSPLGIGGREGQRGRGAEERTVSKPSTLKPITPVQGWTFNNKGEVVLTAYNPNSTGPQRLRANQTDCSAP